MRLIHKLQSVNARTSLFLYDKKQNKSQIEVAKMALSQDASLTFFTGLRGFHIYRSCWKPFVCQKIEFRNEKNNKHNKYAVAGYTKLPGKLVLCVVGHMPREISRCIWFATQGGANITARVVSTTVKQSPLTQGGLEIEIKVLVVWENNKDNLEVLADKVNSVQFTLGEPYADDTKNILSQIKEKENTWCFFRRRR